MQKYGYEILTKAVPLEFCDNLRNSLHKKAQVICASNKNHNIIVRIKDLLGYGPKSIRSPSNRLHMKLNLDSLTKPVLLAAVSALANRNTWKDVGLNEKSRLVELSCMVSNPGSEIQDAHTDVPPDTKCRIATVWIALQDTFLETGPTFVLPAPPNELSDRFNWHKMRQKKITHYTSEGIMEEFNDENEDEYIPKYTSDLGLGDPVGVVLKAGDIMLLDCRTFHYGGANTSSTPRYQLSATFQNDNNDNEDETERNIGFTYELKNELRGKYRLSDFIQ